MWSPFLLELHRRLGQGEGESFRNIWLTLIEYLYRQNVRYAASR